MGSCITQVSAGRCHTLAATKHGRVYSFGLGGSGQLGIGSTVSRNFPQCVNGPWVEINVKDLLLRDGERSLCSVTTLPHGIVNPLANVKVISDDSSTSKSPLPTGKQICLYNETLCCVTQNLQILKKRLQFIHQWKLMR